MNKEIIATDLLDLSVEEISEVMLEDQVYTGQRSQLIVYNDDFNTFDWVIQCFIEVCNHTFEQSEQLSRCQREWHGHLGRYSDRRGRTH